MPKKRPVKKPTESLASYQARTEKATYSNRIQKVGKFHKFTFPASKLAAKGKLSGPQKSAITRVFKSLRHNRKALGDDRQVFVKVPSSSRRRRALQTGEVVRSTNTGVFVSIRPRQIEKTKLGRVRVNVGAGGKVVIRYGKRRIETVAANRLRVAKNLGKEIRGKFEKSSATRVSLMIRGYEASGPSTTGKNERGLAEFEAYVNDTLQRIESEVESRNRRLEAQGNAPVDYTARDILAFRFYYGKNVKRIVTPDEVSTFPRLPDPPANAFEFNDEDFPDDENDPF